MEAGIFIVILIIGLAIRLFTGSLDDDRVKREIEAKGRKFISKEWKPFGKGWFGEKNDRIYEVIYIDKAGYKHKAFVKTSMFSGVYFTEDKIIEGANRANPSLDNSYQKNNDLELENKALKAELERLKKRISESKS